MSPVSSVEGEAVLRRLEKEGFRSILVGGLAVEIAGFGGTKDVDVLVPVIEFDGILYLKGKGLKIGTTTGGWVTDGRLTLEDGTTVPFDVLNPERFVGPDHSGEEFFEYVETRASHALPFGRVASPSVVYYTRLLVTGSHGEIYLERILRDLREGAPWTWVEEAIGIAKLFGTEDRVKRRVDRLKVLQQDSDAGAEA